MGKTIQDMVGAKIQTFKKVFDYWQIVSDKGIINIYNPSKYFALPQENYFEMKEVKERDLVNAIITNVIFETGKYLKLELNYEKVIETSLIEGDYMGPEAISISYNTGEIIVFE
jgi:hypothetical protein